MAEKIIKVTVRYIPNVVEHKGRVAKELTYPYEGFTSVYDLLSDIKRGDIPDIPKTVLKKHKIIINGKNIEEAEWKKTALHDKDEVIITPEVKEVFSLAILGGFLGFGIGSGLGLVGAALFNAVLLGFSIGGVIGGLLFMPSIKVDADFNTPTYGWQGMSSYVSPENPIPVVYGQLRIPLRYINMYATNEIQYDAVWRKVTPTSQVESGFTNQFQVVGEKLKIYLSPMVAIPQVAGSMFYYFVAAISEIAGNLIPTAPQSERINQLEYVTGGSMFNLSQKPRFLGYLVEYKKPSDVTWTEYGWTFPTFNFWRTVMPTWIIMAAPQKTAAGEAEFSLINPLFIELPEAGTWDIRISLGGVNVRGAPTGTKYWQSVQVYMPPSETNTDKTYLNLLGALGEGEFAGIDTSSIEIDGNPIGNYDSNAIEIYTRNGANDDKPINGFNEIHAYTNFSYGLNNPLDSATHTTTGTEVQAFSIMLALNGLYRINKEGKVYVWDVTYRVEWKLHSSPTWSSANSDEITISMKQQTQFTKQYRKDHLTAGQYDIRVTRLSAAPDFRHVGNMAWTELDEIRYDDLAYPNLAKVAMKILATEKLSGTIPNITVVAKGRKVLQPKILNAGGDWLHYDDYYYDWDNQKYVEFATDSEAFWDGVTWVEDWTANPVWIMYDLWRTSRPGISDYVDGEIHTENLPEMANYSDSLVLTEEGGDTYEKRFRMDVCVDAEQRAADLFRTLASTFRAFVFQTGGKMKLVIDKEETVSQKFTMGNIVTKGGKTTFKSAFSSLKSSPNVVEVQYLDQSQNYQRNVVLFEDSEALAAGEPIRKQSLSLMLGVARTSQALRMAKYYMYLSKYCVRASSFNAALDAVTATCGDLISIQHDVTGWGYGGRVGSGSTTSKVTLDGSVILAAGTTYELLIRFNDDTIERRDITSAAGTHTSITVSAPFSQIPAKYDLWEIVTKALGEKMFKIISIGRDNLEEVDITGLEYNESIYDDVTGIVLPTPNYSLLRRNAPVTDLTLSESTARLKDGTVEMAINVSFNKPEQAIAYSHAKIYISENDGESWECAGETSETFFTIVGGVYELTTYKVAVSSVTKTGEELSENKWATATITTSGKLLPPEDITGFSVTQSYDKLVLGWNAVSDLDVSYYEIRRGASWDSGVVISRTQQIEIELLSFPFGYQKYYIKARDTSGNYSVNPAFASITVTEIPGKIPILSLLDSALTGDVGAGLDTEYYDGRNLGRFEKCVLLTTQRVWDEDSKTWDEVESEGIRYDYPVESVGYYTGEVQDIGFKASVFISPEVDILAEGDEATHIIEERHSDDNVVWTDWAELESGATECRYIQFRIKLQTTDEDVNIRLFSFGANVNLPEVIEYQNNVAIADIGTTIEFNKTFHTDALGIVVTVIGNPYIPYITDITKDDVKVFLNDGSDDVAGNVNIVITGF